MVKQVRWVALWAGLWRSYQATRRDPAKLDYTDESMAIEDEHEGERDMFQTDEAKVFVVEQRRMDKIRADAVA